MSSESNDKNSSNVIFSRRKSDACNIISPQTVLNHHKLAGRTVAKDRLLSKGTNGRAHASGVRSRTSKHDIGVYLS